MTQIQDGGKKDRSGLQPGAAWRRVRSWWPAGVAIAIALVIAAIWDGPSRGVDIYVVRDGDTLELTPRDCALSRIGLSCLPQRLRLFGVDAFERAQSCRDAEGKSWPCGDVAT